MQITEKKISDVNFEFTFAFDKKKIDEGENIIIKQLARNLKVKGFRKGKVPLSIAKKHISKLEVRKYLLEEFYKEALQKIIDEYKIKPVDIPKISLISKSITEDDIVSFKVYGDRYPDINIENYKGIKVEYDGQTEITDEEVEKSTLDIVKASLGQEKLTKEDIAKEKDIAYIEYKVLNEKDEKVKFKSIVLDKSIYEKDEFSKTLVENILAKKQDDVFTINYDNKDYEVKIISLYRVPKFELTDDFVKSKFGYDSVKKFKEDVKKGLEIKLKEKRDEYVFSKIIDKFLEVDIKVPDSLLDYTYKKMEKDFEEFLKRWNITEQDYLEKNNLTKQDLQKDFKETALKIIKRDLILDYVAEKERLQVKEEDINLTLNSMIKTKDDVKKIKSLLKDENWRKDLFQSILRQKARKILIDNAEVILKTKEDNDVDKED